MEHLGTWEILYILVGVREAETEKEEESSDGVQEVGFTHSTVEDG